jgi:hypothetical protein
VKFLTAGEAKLMNDYTRPDVRRQWDLWVRELG